METKIQGRRKGALCEYSNSISPAWLALKWYIGHKTYRKFKIQTYVPFIYETI